MSHKGAYILNDKHEPVPCDDVLVWGPWFEVTANRRVAETLIGDVRVSTMFLAIDPNFFGDGDPILFETMIFAKDASHPLHEWQRRAKTWDEALAIHEEACELVRRGRIA